MRPLFSSFTTLEPTLTETPYRAMEVKNYTMANVFGLSVDPQALLGLPGCHESSKSRAELPSGFPSALVSPLAWKPDDILARKGETILRLTPSDLAEICTAIAGLKSRSLSVPTFAARQPVG